MRKEKYSFRGLDLRTNELYRQEGTASDCRNVRLDAHRRLVKREDLDAQDVPRSAVGQATFEYDKLHRDAIIVGVMPYEDHKIIVTKIFKFNGASGSIFVNQYYKWIESTNTIEWIPMNVPLLDDTSRGFIANRGNIAINGRMQFKSIENILYFSGDYADTDMDETASAEFQYDIDDATNNRTPLFKYDGAIIELAGIGLNTADDIGLSGYTLATNEKFARILPLDFDDKGRKTFGNYISTLAKPYSYGGDIGLSVNMSTHTEFTGGNHLVGGTCLHNGTILETDTLANRTINMDLFDMEDYLNTSEAIQGQSISKGQRLYTLRYNGSTSPSPATDGYSDTLYRFDVEEVNFVGGTITAYNFYKYDDDLAKFIKWPGLELISGTPMSNKVMGVYTSDDFRFGYEFKNFDVFTFRDTSPTGLRLVVESVWPDRDTTLPLAGPLQTLAPGFLTEVFEDQYDEESVKLAPPKMISFTPYLGAVVVCDETSVYFSDFSVGGTIENFTPFDTLPVGSSEFGPITGVFANETFLAVFRQRETYHLTGNLFTQNYRIQSYKSTRIGCSSPSSIKAFKGAGVFVSEKGVYVCAQGGRMEEISDLIEPIFDEDILGLELDMFDAKTLIDFKKEIIIVDFASKIDADTSYQLVYSYYHKDWFLYEGISTRGGISLIDDKMYTSDGDDIYVESTDKLAAEAFYRSNFESLQVPSLTKRFLKLWISTIGMMDSFSLGIKTYKNWNLGESITDEVKDGDGSTTSVVQNLTQGSRSLSVAIEIVAGSGQPLVVEGYEYDVDGFSKVVKHDNL